MSRMHAKARLAPMDVQMRKLTSKSSAVRMVVPGKGDRRSALLSSIYWSVRRKLNCTFLVLQGQHVASSKRGASWCA